MTEALRLTRAVHGQLPDDGEVAGLLALMLVTDARRAARTGAHGELIPLAKQERSRWDRALIDEGVALISAALSGGSIGAYQLQAAIAAVHDDALRVEDTDWPQIPVCATTTGSRRCAHTCRKWLVTPSRQSRTTSPPLAAPRVFPSAIA